MLSPQIASTSALDTVTELLNLLADPKAVRKRLEELRAAQDLLNNKINAHSMAEVNARATLEEADRRWEQVNAASTRLEQREAVFREREEKLNKVFDTLKGIN